MKQRIVSLTRGRDFLEALALLSGRSPVAVLCMLAILSGLGAACRSLPLLPPADLSAPGWRLQPGQAVWKSGENQPELAGELLLATNARGDCFVQFSKTPFTLATAQVANDRWQIQFGSGEYERRGRGRPPHRFVWFQVPRAVAGSSAGGDWRFERLATNSWRLENRRTGEWLETHLFP